MKILRLYLTKLPFLARPILTQLLQESLFRYGIVRELGIYLRQNYFDNTGRFTLFKSVADAAAHNSAILANDNHTDAPASTDLTDEFHDNALYDPSDTHVSDDEMSGQT
ncbi:hypothetical protein CLU79DRAFT_716081 [Phycomyces nitens]|nr:hypothetical protein CLU79DRAFT_716081 [Phycomyces nitens]